MKMIELNKECWNCYGDGFVIEETTGNREPWLQNEVQLTCDHCNGNGFVVDKDELPYRIEEIKEFYCSFERFMNLYVLDRTSSEAS